MTREEAIYKVNHLRKVHPSLCIDAEDFWETVIAALEQEPKTGKWIRSNVPCEEYVCSKCGGACWYYDVEKNVTKSRFCPNCGAKMK